MGTPGALACAYVPRSGCVWVQWSVALPRRAGSSGGRLDESIQRRVEELEAEVRVIRRLLRRTGLSLALVDEAGPTVAASPLEPIEPVKPEEVPNDWPVLEEVERKYIGRVMAHVDGNKTVAAKILGINVKTLYNKLKLEEP